MSKANYWWTNSMEDFEQSLRVFVFGKFLFRLLYLVLASLLSVSKTQTEYVIYLGTPVLEKVHSYSN